MRAKWEAEKRSKENSDSGEGLKVFDEQSTFYHAFHHLQENLPFKVAIPYEKAHDEFEIVKLQGLSRQLVSMLRWNLPKTGIAYDSVDDSVHLEDAAKHLKRSPEAIVRACSPFVGGKGRLIVF